MLRFSETEARIEDDGASAQAEKANRHRCDTYLPSAAEAHQVAPKRTIMVIVTMIVARTPSRSVKLGESGMHDNDCHHHFLPPSL